MSADIGRRLLAEGHHRVNFAIVAAGANAASPHHEPGDRVIEPGEVVLCDFGGTMLIETASATAPTSPGACTPASRPPSSPSSTPCCYDAQAAAVRRRHGRHDRAKPSTPWPAPIIADAGYGDYFIHRTGHGIGIEAHEDPYIVSGNTTPLEPGHAFSIEPGIYIPGRWGARLEDIVVAAAEARPPQQRRPRPRRRSDQPARGVRSTAWRTRARRARRGWGVRRVEARRTARTVDG